MPRERKLIMDAKSEKYKKKAAQGAIWLIVKRIVIQVVFTSSNILLARLLFPADFGTYAIILFVGVIFTVFSDLGFGPSLIQRKEELEVSDLRTVFSVQLLLCLIIMVILFLVAPYISAFYSIGNKGTLLFRLYTIIFLFGPFKTVSAALLERKLAYGRLSFIEVLEGIFGAICTLVLAFSGFGVISFVIGSIVAHIVSMVLYLVFSPWSIGFSFDINRLKSFTKFGFPYQMNIFFGLFYGSLIFLYLGKVVGPVNLGYYQFALNISLLPLAVSEILSRIIFPFGARLQDDKKIFVAIIERSLELISLTTLPIIAIGVVIAPQVVHYIYTDKWLIAVPALIIGLLQMGVLSYTGIFGQVLLSKGYSKVMRNIGVVWAVMTWILAPILIDKFGFIGMNLAGLIVSLSGFWLFLRLRKEVKFSWLMQTGQYLASAVISALFAKLLLIWLPETFANFTISVFLSLLAYFILVTIFRRKQIGENLYALISIIR